MREKRTAYRILGGNPEVKIPLVLGMGVLLEMDL
jgi:hypothetical protein